jgi:hypothetical protein
VLPLAISPKRPSPPGCGHMPSLANGGSRHFPF